MVKGLEPLQCVSLVLSSLALVFNGAGLIFLFHKKSILAKNAEIFSISAATILYSTVMSVRLLCSRYLSDPVPVDFILYNVFNTCMIPFYGNMIILTLQRYFAIRLHLRYQNSWVKLHHTQAIVFTWVFGAFYLVLTIVWLLVIGPSPVWLYVIWVQGALGPVVTNLIFVIVYVYIYIKYREANESSNVLLKKKRKIFTPFIICFSFFIFGTVPHFFQSKVKKLSYSVIWFSLDGIVNSFVYLAFNQRLARRFKGKRRERVSPRATTVKTTTTANTGVNSKNLPSEMIPDTEESEQPKTC